MSAVLSAKIAVIISLVSMYMTPVGRVYADSGPDSGPVAECVILLHGLGRTYRSLQPMAKALHEAGYLAVNLGYPSRQGSVEHLAHAVIPGGIARCEVADAAKIHFVTHSLGGILVRQFLRYQRPPNLGRVVMLSPPNRGSEVADRLVDWPPYQWINGPAGQQLITGADGLPQQQGPVDYPVGVITGDRFSVIDAWTADVFDGPHDGKVSVSRAAVEGMTDFLVVPYSHPFILKQESVMAETIHFLRHGRFTRGWLESGSMPDWQSNHRLK